MSFRVVRLLVLIAAVSPLVSGCAKWDRSKWDVRGKGFDDSDDEWLSKVRPPADEGRMSGFDTRAREIERNLGVR